MRLVTLAGVLATAALSCFACSGGSAVGNGDGGVQEDVAAADAPEAAPDDAAPSWEGGLPLPPPNAIAILVDPETVLHPASSFVLASNRNHVEADIVDKAGKLAKLAELTPTWGGGQYLYRIGSVATDGRTDISDWVGYHFESWFGLDGPTPYDDLRNALDDATTAGAAMLHVVNFGTGTPEEAGRYVSYLNRADDVTRGGQGLPPWNVTYFEIGSDPGWSLVRGHDTYAATDVDYATRALLFAQAMRANSDVPILVGANVSIDSRFTGEGWNVSWTIVKNVLETMGTDVDFLTFHGYPSWPVKDDSDLRTYMAQNSWTKAKIQDEILPAIADYAAHPVFLANTEFYTGLGSNPGLARAQFGALYSADTIITSMNLDVRMAVQFSFDDDDLADSSYFIGNDVAKVTPLFRLHQMLAQAWGDDIVASHGQNLPSYALTDVTTDYLGFAAATNAAGHVFVLVVNRTPDADVTAWLHPGFLPTAAHRSTLAGTSGWTSNWSQVAVTDSTPDVTSPLTFPAASVSLFEFTP